MWVIPLTSVLSHKGRGCRCPKLDDTWSLEVKEIIKHALSNYLKTTHVIPSYHASTERHRQMKMDALGSWFDKLTTSGLGPVWPEALEGRTGYFQSRARGDILRS